MQRLGSIVARLLRHRPALLFLLIGIAYLFSGTASALPPSPGKIPNGSVYSCGSCHESGHVFSDNSPPVPGTPAHGNALQGPFLAANKIWTADLANQDSDGDGFTNGEELQDPAGAWAIGQADPGDVSFVSNPSDSNPGNDTYDCTLNYRATPPTPLLLSLLGAESPARGNVRFGVSARSPLPIDFVRYTVKNAASQVVFDQFSNAAPFHSPPWDTRGVPDGNYTLTAQLVERRVKAGVTPRGTTLSTPITVGNSAAEPGARGELVGTPPNACDISESFSGIAAISGSDIWAVGTRFLAGPGPRSLIEHWDGVRWTSTISPNVGTDDNLLHAGAASGPSDVWAVGEYLDTGGFARTLTLRWDGARWRAIASPNVSPNGVTSNNRLLGVTALAPNSAWAVGSYDQQTSSRPLILRWNGASWQSVAAPEPAGATNLQLNAVAARSATDAWAVGSYIDTSFNRRTLTLHWNGSAWSIVPSPNPNSFLNALNAVTASLDGEIWAVGYTSSGTGYRSLAMRWNGTSWQVAASPHAGAEFDNNELLAVATAGPGDVWAVGYSGANADDGQPLALHWNGIAWQIVAQPATTIGALKAAAGQPGEIWAAGANTGASAARTLVARFHGPREAATIYLPLIGRP
jgi:hypothetical protein